MFENLIQSLVEKTISNNLTRRDIIRELFQNKELKDTYVNEIRRSTLIGKIANEVLSRTNKTDFCKVLAIGDIEYFGTIKDEWNTLVASSLYSVSPDSLGGYDLSGQGTDALRTKLLEYMNLYYDFSPIQENLVPNILPTYGGTDGFVAILDSIRSMVGNSNIRFVYPESSFIANVRIAESIFGEDSCIKINKPSSHDFFLSKEQIGGLYKQESILDSRSLQSIYYITPVGNPTGEKIDERKLLEILTHIHSLDNKAIFILDTVYVGLLQNTDSRTMFEEIFQNTPLLNQIIFAESLSKTLGTTGIRIGWIWTLNPVLLQELKKTIILKKAGFSKILDTFTVNLLSDLPRITNFQEKVYDFWSSQRLAFMEIISRDFSHLFDLENCPKVREREGIYVFLKTREGLSLEDIFAETGIIGVGIELSDGLYIRYAFGNVEKFM